MNKTFKTIASAMVMFALATSAFATPMTTVIAQTTTESTQTSSFSFSDTLGDIKDRITGGSDTGTESNGESSASSGSSSFTECVLEASSYQITTGDSVTLMWQTEGFDQVKIDGQLTNELDGSKIVEGLFEDTVFTLEALQNDGASKCVTQVKIDCEPPVVPMRCEDYGYDFEIGKFEWDGHKFEQEDTIIGYDLAVTGDTNVANWTANPAVAGVIAKASTDVDEFAGGTSGSIAKADIGTGQHAISHIAFCGNETPKYCELEVDKSVSTHEAIPGQELTYTIEVKNTGDAVCTGGGVRIEDVVDSNLSYLRHELTNNLSAGYGNKPVYTSSDRTLRFNGHDLEPGEAGTITWVGKVTEPTQCGDFEVKNQAKATAKELDNFKTWSFSQTVKTQIDNDCGEPKVPECTLTPSVQTVKYGETATLAWTTDYATSVKITDFGNVVFDGSDNTLPLYANTSYTLTATGEGGTVTCDALVKVERDEPKAPECPLSPAEGRTIVNFAGGKLRTDKSLDRAETSVQSMIIGEGKYDITLVSWDGYNARVNASQPNEQWQLQFIDNGSVFASSGIIGDLEDNVREAIKTEKVNTDFILSQSIDGVRAVQPFYPDTTSPNSLYPICAAIDEQEVETAKVIAHKIVCTDEAQLPNYGNGGPNMTPSTAADWVATNDTCSFVEGWEFQWTDDQSNDPGDTLVGTAGNPWNTFGPTDSNGKTTVEINLDKITNDRVWFREVLKDGYIPFTHGQNAGTNVDDFSAEFYCDTDVINYDNRDFVSGMVNGETYHCVAWNSPEPITPPPSCDLFTATPGAITVGDTVTLTWETTNGVQAFLNNGIGEVDLDGNIEVSPIASTTYQLTVIGAEDKVADCEVPVAVSEDSVPVCKAFTATPSNLPVGGGDVNLEWEVEDAEEIVITPTVGTTTDLNGSQTVNVTESTTFTLTATDENGDKVSCPAPVAVADPEPIFTCADNVTFSASDTSIDRGDDITLTWNTTNVDSVAISVINETSLSGSREVSPSSDVEYILTATRGNESIQCPLSIDVDTGGGGGGSSSPRCDLDISDTRITRGEEITLTWDTTRATEVTITDDRGDVVFTTDDYLADDKEDYYDGEITLTPTRDTEYTLLAERGSRDRECKVEVEIEDEITVLETRDQAPLVAGISLSQVPYTGFEAGPFMTLMFYALLVAWSLYITYLLVVRNRPATEMAEATITETPQNETVNAEVMRQAEARRPDVFTPSVVSQQTKTDSTPANLPTGAPTIGYENHSEEVAVNPHQVDDQIVTELENRAHEQKALLSSDAVRHFIATTAGTVERNEAMDEVIAEAKKHYPLEDGWIVINEARMQNLCETCQLNREKQTNNTFVPATVPGGTGSLAEAIVTGNVVAAYDMIGNRPMFALADAAADLDAVYRKRRGNDVEVSDLLVSETANLSDEKIQNMINALTGALDGTYTDEASAVKMAIMKAVKEVA